MEAHAILRAAVGVCLLLLTADALATAPETEARRDTQHRINISGRQRMLSQRIAKAACLAAWEPANGQPLQELADAHALFKSSMKALTDASHEIVPAPEEVALVLDTATQLGRQYNAAVDEFVAAFPAKQYQAKLEAIYELSLPLVASLNDAVDYLEAQHSDGHLIRRGLAAAINVSGGQRMLSQMMAKELCMIASGYKPRETRAHMRDTVAFFVSSHEGLKRDLMEMKLEQKDLAAISAQLGLIEQRGQKVREIYIRVSGGGDPSSLDVKTVAVESTPFLIELDRAVQLYEAIDIPEETSR
jgi:hypothetical protein